MKQVKPLTAKQMKANADRAARKITASIKKSSKLGK